MAFDIKINVYQHTPTQLENKIKKLKQFEEYLKEEEKLLNENIDENEENNDNEIDKENENEDEDFEYLENIKITKKKKKKRKLGKKFAFV
jgi:hypothetical protein